MKPTISSVILCCLAITVVMTVHGQHPAVSQRGYNPTVPRLVSMRHKAVSNTSKPVKTTVQDFDEGTNQENINVYVVYEKDSTIGKSTGNEELLNPPRKLMDLYLIYDYTYRIYCSDNNVRIPKVQIQPGHFVNGLEAVSYSRDNKGKLKSKKIRKSSITSVVTGGLLSIELNKSEVIQNSFVEISIQIKSRNFAALLPSISPGRNFNKSLTVSYPTILSYKSPNSPILQLVASSTSEFELLDFARDPGPGNGNIKTFKVESRSYSWKIHPVDDGDYQIAFELDRVNLPSSADIGIMPTDILNVK